MNMSLHILNYRKSYKKKEDASWLAPSFFLNLFRNALRIPATSNSLPQKFYLK